MKAAVEKAWEGEPKLVIGIDVGTTQCETLVIVSYKVLVIQLDGVL
jgi:N-acetylglucosamine kinase-like BadF-type ATPase